MKHKGESLTLVSARCAVVHLISGILAEMKMRKEQYLEIDRKKGFPSSFLLLSSLLPSHGNEGIQTKSVGWRWSAVLIGGAAPQRTLGWGGWRQCWWMRGIWSRWRNAISLEGGLRWEEEWQEFEGIGGWYSLFLKGEGNWLIGEEFA